MAAIDKIISQMTIEQKVGQLFTLGFTGGVITPEVIKMISNFNCGGLRITPNVKVSYSNYKQIKAKTTSRPQDVVPIPSVNLSPYAHLDVLNEFQNIATSRNFGIPLHISLDWEGGISADICRGGYPLFPSAMGLACSKDAKMIETIMCCSGKLLRASGITNIHSPVLDINSNPENPEINIRSYGDTPIKVAHYAKAALKGYLKGGIIATAKHFPGSGHTHKDAHYYTIVLDKSKKELMKNEIYPYIELIKEGLPSIMLGHLICPALDNSRLPATISKKIIQDFIRKELGFEGVVTTDSMTMEAMQKICPATEACALAIQAGVDMVLYKTEDLELVKKTIGYAISMVKNRKISEDQIDASVKRVLVMKNNINLFQTKGYNNPEILQKMLTSEKIHKLAQKAADNAALLIRDRKKLLPLKPTQKILVVEQSMFTARYCNDEYFHPYMLWEMLRKYYPGTELFKLDFYGNDNNLCELLKIIPEFDIVIATNMYNRGSFPNTQFLNKLADKVQKLVIITNTPYPLTVSKKMDGVLCLFSKFTPSLKTAVEILFDTKKASKNWPIKFRPE
ncbi:MAG: hypothetical protein A2Y10_02405 [Planctomycetes bacterium GWF2_41_51]|nr:MAG: hypothetical protein A2Y10_02405 [Planctomycetes bacterium GWF2_41_51]HBG27279.1 hypothetical protein [Phycisphaerales bacterium]